MDYEDKQRRNFLSLFELGEGCPLELPRDSTPWQFLYILRSKWFGIIATKFEKTRIPFLIKQRFRCRWRPRILKDPSK